MQLATIESGKVDSDTNGLGSLDWVTCVVLNVVVIIYALALPLILLLILVNQMVWKMTFR